MNYTITYNFKGKDLTVNVKPRIPFYDVEEIINGIVDGVFENGKYYPSRYDYYYVYLLLSQYTDLDMDQFTADEIYELAEGPSSLYAQVYAYISSTQNQTILSSADKLIQERLNEHPLKKICEDLHSLIGSFDKFVEELNANPDMVASVLGLLKETDVSKIAKFKSVLENK